MQRILLVCSFILGTWPVAFCQYINPVPTTPDAARFAKSANYPVNLNTGVPDIGVPLTTIDAGGGLSIPVNISYHAGGFKISEQSGTVGLGWSLSTDLQITRTINGIDDFAQYGYINNPNVNFYPIYTYPWTQQTKYGVATGQADGMPDRFNYKLLDKSGTFYFVRKNGTYYAAPVPYENIRIVFNNNQFIITDVDGTTYYFGRPVSQATGDNNDYMGYEQNSGAPGPITAWKCIRIVAANNTNTIDFTYAKAPVIDISAGKDKIEYVYNTSPCNLISQMIYPTDSRVTGAGSSYNLLMSNISSRMYMLSSPRYMEFFDGLPKYYHLLSRDASTGAILDKRFNFDGNSTPYISYSETKPLILSSISFRGGSVQFLGNDRVNSIRIMNTRNQLVKSFQFYYSFTVPNNLTAAQTYNGANYQGTMYLDSLFITGNDAAPLEKYRFLYKRKTSFGYHLKGNDAWGYRNGKTVEIAAAFVQGLPNLTPAQDLVHDYFAQGTCGVTSGVAFPVGTSGTDEYPDEFNMQSGMLKRIVYPTGGYVDFDFEANRYQELYSTYSGISKPLLFAGGLRIQKITFYDGKSGYKPAWQKYYTYGELESGEGLLLNRPPTKYVAGKLQYGKYMYVQNLIYSTANGYTVTGDNYMPSWVVPCTGGPCVINLAVEKKLTLMPNSAGNLGYAGGAPVYYTKVTEYEVDRGTQTGRKVFQFYGPNDFLVHSFNSLINNTNIPYLNSTWDMGATKSVSDYKFVAGHYKLVFEKDYEYSLYQKNEQPLVSYSFLYNIYNINNTSLNVYLDPLQHYQGPTPQEQDFVYSDYGIPIGKLLLKKETEKTYDDVAATPFSSVKQYFYDNSSYVQPTRITTDDGKGGQITTTLKYPYDYSTDPVYTAMVSQNILSPVVESIVTNSIGGEISRAKTNYALINTGYGFYAPVSIQKSTLGRSLITDLTFDQYDQWGNQLQITEKGVVKSFVYGYNSKYLIAELQGAPYSAVPSGITSSIVLNNPDSDPQLLSTLDPLRSLTGTNLVNLFTMKPFIGVTSITNKRGQRSYYEYDGYNRLAVVRDNNNQVVKKYEYAFGTVRPEALTLFYTNKPMLGTYNDAYCQPWYTDGEPTVIAPMGRNRLIPSGTVINSNDNANADFDALTQLENTTNGSSACSTGYNYATLKLSTYLWPTTIQPPYYMYLDLYQNGSLAVSYKFPTDVTGATLRSAYLPAGDYQVSLRPDPSYRGNVLKYWFSTPAGGQWVETGSTISISNNTTYTLQVNNTL
jgi:YD repeat-containing protein